MHESGWKEGSQSAQLSKLWSEESNFKHSVLFKWIGGVSGHTDFQLVNTTNRFNCFFYYYHHNCAGLYKLPTSKTTDVVLIWAAKETETPCTLVTFSPVSKSLKSCLPFWANSWRCGLLLCRVSFHWTPNKSMSTPRIDLLLPWK